MESPKNYVIDQIIIQLHQRLIFTCNWDFRGFSTPPSYVTTLEPIYVANLFLSLFVFVTSLHYVKFAIWP